MSFTDLLKRPFSSNKQSERKIGFSTFTMADKAAIAEAKKVLIDMAFKTRQLTKKDIDNWRMAWQVAINYETPKRNRLLDVYNDVIIDAHLNGAIRNRKIKTMSKSFRIVNIKTGEENPELTQILEAGWFKRFISLSLDSIFWGHSLIEFGNVMNTTVRSFDQVKLIPREHVVPEYNRVLKDPSDEWNKGFDFTIPPFSDWCISVGDPYDLGILLNASPHCISKKNMMAYWDEFGELFGMPIRIGTTSTRDPNERVKVESMLTEMGSKAWGLFPEGTDIKLIETTRGDAYNVYDKRVERCNSELSKLINGVTMVMDNGSSKSQAQVHEHQFDDICDNDADFVRDVINTKLFPLLKIHGFNFDNHRFDWDESIDYTPEQQLDIDKFMVENFEIDPQVFADKYNTPVIGPKQNAPSSFFD